MTLTRRRTTIPILNLPIEIYLLILYRLADTATLEALLLACPFYILSLAQQKHICYTILLRTLGASDLYSAMRGMYTLRTLHWGSTTFVYVNQSNILLRLPPPEIRELENATVKELEGVELEDLVELEGWVGRHGSGWWRGLHVGTNAVLD